MEMSPEAPTVSLELASRAENLTLVRGMIGGVGELLAIDPELLDDVKTAVSEACNNVVMHAYHGDSGPLVVSLYAQPDGIAVAVRDQGQRNRLRGAKRRSSLRDRRTGDPGPGDRD